MTSVSPIVRAILEQPAQYAGQTIPGDRILCQCGPWDPHCSPHTCCAVSSDMHMCSSEEIPPNISITLCSQGLL